MKITPQFIFRALIVLAMFIAGGFFYKELPDQMPIHWNFAGEVDNWGSKIWANWLMPGIGLAMLILFPMLSKIDPKKENYESFKGIWEIIQTCLILFFGYIYAVQFYVIFNSNEGNIMGQFIMAGIGVLFIILGNYMGKIRQNYFIGLKTPWSLADPEVWQKSQRFTGWMFVLGGIVFLIDAWLQLYLPAVTIGIVVGVALLPIVYSYLVFRNKKN